MEEGSKGSKRFGIYGSSLGSFGCVLQDPDEETFKMALPLDPIIHGSQIQGS